jgi:hypothetical protein
MTATVHPSPVADAATDAGATPTLHLRLVRSPQPPLADPREPVRLVLPGVPVPRPLHRPGPRPRPDRPHALDDDFGPAWSTRADLPSPADVGRSIVLLALEVMTGRRPVTQLRAVTTPGLFASLSGGRRPRWCAEGTAPLVLGRVHVCEPVDGVAEVSVVARRAGRAHAVAARLEGLDGRWRCTALQIG